MDVGDFKFNCPHCEQPLEAPEDMRGQVVSCPKCNGQIRVPGATPNPPLTPRPLTTRPTMPQQPAGETIFCSKCGERNRENNLKCTRCGHYLHGTPAPQAVVTGDDSAAMRMLLPVGRSGWAIASGYLGLFSVLLVFAPFALLTGILAVADIRRHSDKHGMGRAIFGIVMGVLGTIGLIALIIASMS
jgi:DNA-directed RNA polymerase subunit RPC12/RpoP